MDALLQHWRQLLTPQGQGFQGIRAGLIGLGWIRGQGSHPTAQGGRFRSCWEQARGQHVQDTGTGHIPEPTLGLVL